MSKDIAKIDAIKTADIVTIGNKHDPIKKITRVTSASSNYGGVENGMENCDELGTSELEYGSKSKVNVSVNEDMTSVNDINKGICPICNKRIYIQVYESHVYACLDKMDEKNLAQMQLEQVKQIDQVNPQLEPYTYEGQDDNQL